MGRIDWKRVLLGGLVAGLVFNALEFFASFFTGPMFVEAMERLGMTLPVDTASFAYYLVLGFIYGIAIIWIYAAIRPRFGPGPRTAIIAGLVAWFMTGVLNALGFGPLGIFPARLWAVWMTAWAIELPLAALAGAWLYRELGEPQMEFETR